MSNKCLRIIWFKLSAENGKGFHLRFPISLSVFLELLDSIDDLLTVIGYFAPKSPISGSRLSVHSIKELTRMLIALFGSLTENGPYELIDVTADNVKVSVKIR